MKKLEKSEISINSFDCLKYGQDYEAIKKYLENKGVDLNDENLKTNKIVYVVTLNYFVEGKNTFTIKLDDRKEFIKRKKELATTLLKKENYKKALKILKTVIEYCTLGLFNEDQNVFKAELISAYLNSSLCFWKMSNWGKMKEQAKLAYKLDSKNVKAVYRIALSEWKEMNHETAVRIIEENEGLKSEELENLKDQIKKELKEIGVKEKAMYKNCFN